MKRSLPTVALVAAAAIVALLVYGVVARQDDLTIDDAVKQGEFPAAPGMDLARPKLDGGGELRLADFKGQIVVLNFWASWCDPCRAEAPILQRAQKDLEARGDGTVIGATFNDEPDASKAFEKEFGITYPSVRDVGTKLAEEYGTNKLPETFIIDPEGKIVAVSRGQVREDFVTKGIALARAQR